MSQTEINTTHTDRHNICSQTYTLQNKQTIHRHTHIESHALATDRENTEIDTKTTQNLKKKNWKKKTKIAEKYK